MRLQRAFAVVLRQYYLMRGSVARLPLFAWVAIDVVALALGDLLLASWVFARTHRRALATGLIARYSAETVT